jgi:hypothetical protein
MNRSPGFLDDVVRQQQREKAAFLYHCALERGDFEAVADVLQEAEDDPVLEHMLLDLNQFLSSEILGITGCSELLAPLWTQLGLGDPSDQLRDAAADVHWYDTPSGTVQEAFGTTFRVPLSEEEKGQDSTSSAGTILEAICWAQTAISSACALAGIQGEDNSTC